MAGSYQSVGALDTRMHLGGWNLTLRSDTRNARRGCPAAPADDRAHRTIDDSATRRLDWTPPSLALNKLVRSPQRVVNADTASRGGRWRPWRWYMLDGSRGQSRGCCDLESSSVRSDRRLAGNAGANPRCRYVGRFWRDSVTPAL